MIADLILAVIDRRPPAFVEYTDNDAKRAAYLRRSADYHAADPDEYKRRYLAGIAVQRRVRTGNRKAAVLALDNTIRSKRRKATP